MHGIKTQGGYKYGVGKVKFQLSPRCQIKKRK
jgi:hypothetical protein